VPAIDVIEDPFGQDEVPQVRLANNPLALTLFQARFPGTVSALQDAIDDKSLVRALSEDYPYVEPQDIFEIVVQPGKQPEPHRTTSKAWRLSDATRTLFVTISPDSVSFHTTRYKTRTEFLATASKVLEVIQHRTKAPAISRLGLRYTNRVDGQSAVEKLIPRLAVGAQGILSVTSGSQLQHAMGELVYSWPEDAHQILARWGLLPAGATLDPAMPSVQERSWVLDIDCYRETLMDFDAQTLTNELDRLSKRAYRFFRWAVTPDGLEMFGVLDDGIS